MKTLKYLLLTYLFGALTLTSFGVGAYHFWWYAVSVALENTKSEWFTTGVILMLTTVVFGIMTDKCEDRI